MEVLSQDKNYNCGVFCVHFLLGLYGIDADLNELEKIMGTVEEEGTSHEGIKNGLKHFNLQWVEQYHFSIAALQEFFPAIINYQYEDEDGRDGHYAVVLGKGHGFFIIYNPATGEIEMLDMEYLEKNWYSERYGKGWFIQVIKG